MKNQRGQLTIGLAGGFVMVLAILGLVLRSGSITRDKMKLQETSDLASLVAADTQRSYLKVIRQLNEEIENKYQETQKSLRSPVSPCQVVILQFMPRPIWEVERFAQFIGVRVKGNNDVDNNMDLCDKICNGFDNNVRNSMIEQYNMYRDPRAQSIFKIILKGNEQANFSALETFLTPQNLPPSFQREVSHQLGASVSTGSLRDQYDQGRFKDHYEVIDNNKNLPLFIPQLERRLMSYWRFQYLTGPPPTSLCSIIGTSERPRVAVANGKIVKAGDYLTSFFTGAKYSPYRMEDVDKFNIFRKVTRKENAGTSGEEIRNSLGKKESLFQKGIAFITALSLSKPFGGKFPKASNALNPFDRGEPGEDFQGVKLIGLADKPQVGGVDLGKIIGFSGPISDENAQDTPPEQKELLTEDYLH